MQTYQIGHLKRFKKSVPFSRRLNEWIVNRTKDIKFVAGNFEEVDFETFKNESIANGFMKISNTNCEGTIFGDANINVLFRVWHDAIHIELNEDFDYMSEARVCFKQIAELPEDWHFEKQLLQIEIIGQASYHAKTGNFVDDQRAFTIKVLETGII